MKTRMFLTVLGSAALLSQGLSAHYLHLDAATDAVNAFEAEMETMRANPAMGRAIKIQDLVEVVGEERVKLNGFGVVTGLNGTGDTGTAAITMLLTIADKQGIRLDPGEIKKKNIALVSISAEVNPHERTFDVAVKSVGDAKSLQNGFLEGSTLSPLGSSDVYAVASGALALGARYFEASPAGGAVGGASSVTLGHPTMAFVVDGGQLIKDIPATRIRNERITLFLKHSDSRTATNVANSINRYMTGIGIAAEPADASTIDVIVKDGNFAKHGNLTRLIADIGDLPADVARKATITIDQGSGVIAMTEGVKMEPGSIAVAGLTVTVSSEITPVTRQDFLDGETAFIDSPELQVSEDQANFLSVPAGTDLQRVQETFNALRLTPTSIISVFNAMHKAGMIHADIVVIPR